MRPLTPGDNKELAQSELLIINGLELMLRIKAAFRPHGILKSGKVF
jgi:hypothetical protein